MNTSQQTTTGHNYPRLIPLTSWNKYHAWPSESGLRHFIFNAHQNGFDKVFKRGGRRILIDEGAFFDWIDKQSYSSAVYRNTRQHKTAKEKS